MKNGTTTSPEIPLDLAPLLSSLADGEDYSLWVERLPARARLSNGRNNGDQTWSLKPTDLAGLTYLPPEHMNQPHTLTIRVVRIKDDASTTVAVHDISVAPEAVARKNPESDKGPSNGVSAKEVTTQTGARIDVYRLLDIPEPTDDLEEDEPDYTQALSDQIGAARLAGASRLDGLLIKKGSGAVALPTDSEAVARLEQSLKESQETSTAELAAATAHYKKAESSLAQLAEQVESLEKDQTAKQTWQKKLEAERAQACQDIERARQEGSKAAVDAALATARAEWDEALKKRLAASAEKADRQLEQARKEWQKNAKSDLEEAETSLKELRCRVEELQEAQVDLKRTQIEFATLRNRKRFLEDELVSARREIEQARKDGSRETKETELATARAAWETELKQRLAESAADADRQIEESRKEWQKNTDPDLAAATTRFEKAEANLKDLRHRVESLQETETALTTARTEISVLQAQNRAFDIEMTERVAAADKGADLRLEQARTEWEKSSAEELEAARARYTTAEASVESLKRRVEELQANQSTVSDRLQNEAAAAETDPPGKHSRAAVVARSGWKTAKWIYQRALAPVCRFTWRLRPRSAKVRFGLVAVAGVIVGVTYYPSYGPTVVKASEPVIARLTLESVPLWRSISVQWRSISTQIAEILREEPEKYEERVTINVGIANVREGPSTSTKTVATLLRHTDLTVLERRGNWVLVQIDGEGVQTGWIYNTLLVDAASY